MPMKLSVLTTCSIVIITCVGFSKAQMVPKDSDPVLQGSAGYSMPQSAIDAEIDGNVVVAIRVAETGKPTKAALVAGPMWPCGMQPTKALEDLSSTLIDMAKGLRFSPAIVDGKPVTKDVALTLNLINPN